MIDIEELKLATGLLLRIRRECCDGKTGIPMSNINDIAMGILKRADLVVCRNLEKKLEYYVGVSDKGRKLCKLLGVY